METETETYDEVLVEKTPTQLILIANTVEETPRGPQNKAEGVRRIRLWLII